MTLSAPPVPAVALRTTLRDPALQASLATDGFAVTSFLDADQVREARELFATLDTPAGTGFQTDFERADPRRKQLIHDALTTRWQDPLEQLLDGYRAFMCTFLAKWPGQGSELYLHQDWCYIDERRYRSVVVWVALEDVSTARGNGPLQVLPGSHRVAGEYRGTRTASWYTHHSEAVTAGLVPVDVQAGQAVIMDNALVHASPDNTTDQVRLAAGLACIPVEAQLLHPVSRGDGTVDRLTVDDQFFRQETPSLLRDRVPEPWAATAEVEPECWQDADLRLASRLCGTDLLAPDADRPLGPSAPPPVAGPPLTRLANRLLALNHQVISAQDHHEGAFLDPAELPWVGRLEAAASTITHEYLATQQLGGEEPPLSALAGAELPNVGAWRALLIKDNTGWSDEAVARCPETVAVLRGIPGVRSAMFSTLGPWARIGAHRGPNKGVLRAHLGIVVPEPAHRVDIWAGSERASWEAGRVFVFDDTFEHRVANRTDGWRVSLMVEFDRPLEGASRALNRLVQLSFRWHPHVRGANTRRAAVQRALEA